MLALIPLLPLVGFLINAFFGKRLPKSVSGGVACAVMVAAFGVSATVSMQLLGLAPESRIIEQTLYTWIASGDFHASLGFRLDPLGMLMILVVTGIGSLIHIYSTSYMHEETDSEFARYFSYLNLFASFMLMLVLGANLLVMFVGWEGVGLCSYLLIGFYYKKKSASDAGKKAFIVNRIGDFAFVLGVALTFVTFGTIDFLGDRQGGRRHAGRNDVRRALDHHAAVLHRRHRQVRADSALRLAAGRDGRPDAGLRADPCGDDGDGGRVHDRPERRTVLARAADAADRSP